MMYCDSYNPSGRTTSTSTNDDTYSLCMLICGHIEILLVQTVNLNEMFVFL